MRVHTTSSADEFAARVGDWLKREPARNNVLLVHALDPNGVPPGQGDPVFSWVTDGDDIVGAAFARLPYRMPMTEMPDDAARALAEHLVTVLPDLEGVAGAATSAKVFAARWASLTGKTAHSERDQWLMICTETTRPADAAGGPRMSTQDDLETVAEWFMAGMRDSGLPPEQIAQRARQLAGGQIAGGRQIVWEDAEGTPVGAAGWGLNIAGVIRPAGVFVSPDHRAGGYATLLLGEVTARALENGAEACVCTHFLKYESMLAVVEKVGYRRLADFTEYRFE
jgi:predicted GNAT family acetyltransferase